MTEKKKLKKKAKIGIAVIVVLIAAVSAVLLWPKHLPAENAGKTDNTENPVPDINVISADEMEETGEKNNEQQQSEEKSASENDTDTEDTGEYSNDGEIPVVSIEDTSLLPEGENLQPAEETSEPSDNSVDSNETPIIPIDFGD